MDILRSTNYAIERTDDALVAHVRVIISNHTASMAPIDVNENDSDLFINSVEPICVKVVFQHIFGSRHSTHLMFVSGSKPVFE